MIRILFMGRKDVAAQTLQWLSTISNVEVVGVLTDNHIKYSSTQTIADNLGYECYEFEKALADLKTGKLTFDLGISILYWRKLKAEFLVVPKLGVINFHPAPLPDYKGTGGYNYAILDGCRSWGVSAHYMDAEIDSGAIIEVSKFLIDERLETCFSLEEKSRKELKALISRTLDKLLVRGEDLARLPNEGGRYITRREMEAAKEIRPGDDVAKKVRAFWFPPYHGAWLVIDRRRFTLVSRGILTSLAGNEDAINRLSGNWGKYQTPHEIDVAKKVQPGDDVAAKVRKFWCPPYDGAYVEIEGKRYTLVDDEILADLAPAGATSLFTTRFSQFNELD